MTKAIHVFAIVLFSLAPRFMLAQNRLPAFEMNERLGRGVNMGNAFEAPSENDWGNPWKPEYFKIMSELGFDHVRLPVRWEPADRSMASSPYTINPTFLNRIQEVIDEALGNELHIIVNMHHHEALFEDPDGQKERFLSQWNQIATYFKDYPDTLLFEVLNEPHGNLTPDKWNVFFADALTEIRKTNPTRTVIFGVAEYGGLGGIVHLDPPDDENIILSIHYYNPFNFTHQGAEWVEADADAWLGTKWYDTEVDRETVANEFNFAKQFSDNNNIPIHIGEFGAYSKADIVSRERWTTFLARWFEQQGFSWAYWEFSAGFGIYKPSTEEFVEPLVNALHHNEMPDPTPIKATPIYTSNFSAGTDGWTLTAQGGASGALSASNGSLNTSITNGGTENWHVQLVKQNIPFEKDKMYRISFKVKAEVDRSGTFYAGKASDPWTSYSGYKGISIGTSEASYVFAFTMTNPSDLSSRLVFDLGKSTAGVTLSELKVEEIRFVVTGFDEIAIKQKVTFYPNPVSSTLNIEELYRYQIAEMYDLHGRPVARVHVNSTSSVLNMENYPPGIYVLRLIGNGFDDRIKVIKN